MAETLAEKSVNESIIERSTDSLGFWKINKQQNYVLQRVFALEGINGGYEMFNINCNNNPWYTKKVVSSIGFADNRKDAEQKLIDYILERNVNPLTEKDSLEVAVS